MTDTLRLAKGGWRECKLGDLGTLQRGRSRHRPRYAYHLYGGKYPFIQTGEIREAKKYIAKFTQTYNEAGLEQSKLWPAGTLCITIAANIAELAILSFDACFPDSVLGFIPDLKKVDLDFVYYTLTHFQKELKHIGEGSVQDNINLGTFEDVLFPVPPLPEQRAIASVLSSLDDKIDLLNRQNKTLEAMAETLFRKWFVEEAEEDWKQLSLSDIAIFFNGKSRPKGDGNIPVYGGNGILGYTNISNYSGTSIVIGRVGAYCGSLFFVKREIWVSDNALLVRAKNKNQNHYLFYLLKTLNLNSMAEGSSHPLLTQTLLKSIAISLPPEEMIVKFEYQLEQWTKKIQSNQFQNITLEKLRDTLLGTSKNSVKRSISS
jgi:type I restriction enzyme, S subunit